MVNDLKFSNMELGLVKNELKARKVNFLIETLRNLDKFYEERERRNEKDGKAIAKYRDEIYDELMKVISEK